jgi:hypothetical protein
MNKPWHRFDNPISVLVVEILLTVSNTQYGIDNGMKPPILNLIENLEGSAGSGIETSPNELCHFLDAISW